MSTTSSTGVPKPERKKMALKLLADSGLALPARAVYINLELRGATFSYKTVYRHLREAFEEGLVEHPPGKDDYYQITSHGLEYLAEDSDDALT